MRDLAPILLLSFLIWVLIHGTNSFITNYWIQLTFGGLLGAVTYISIAYILHMPELKDVKYLLSKKANFIVIFMIKQHETCQSDK